MAIDSSDGKWTLRLFFSVDLIGSTRYKSESKSQNDDHEWCLTFENFYSGFPLKVREARDDVEPWIRFSDKIDQLEPWKYLGDEILFQVPLIDYREALFHLRSFQKALLGYNEELANKLCDKEKRPLLQCKGAAWLAGFPLSNIEIQTRQGRDFIGPQMDCGFRISKYASERQLAVSVDLALMAATALGQAHKSTRDAPAKISDAVPIRFGGQQELKGVLDGIPYPVFWFDQKTGAYNDEDRWGWRGSTCEPNDIIRYCESFIADTEGLHRPFIESDPCGEFGEIPDCFEDRRVKALRERKSPSSLDVPNETGVTGVSEKVPESAQNFLRLLFSESKLAPEDKD